MLDRIRRFFCKKYNNRLIYTHTPTHSQKESVIRQTFIALRFSKLYILLVIYHVNIPR